MRERSRGLLGFGIPIKGRSSCNGLFSHSSPNASRSEKHFGHSFILILNLRKFQGIDASDLKQSGSERVKKVFYTGSI